MIQPVSNDPTIIAMLNILGLALTLREEEIIKGGIVKVGDGFFIKSGSRVVVTVDVVIEVR